MPIDIITANTIKSPMDLELPRLSSKAQEDFTQSYPIMEASPRFDFNSLSKDISLWMRSRTRKYFQEDSHIRFGFEIPDILNPPDESRLNMILNKQISDPDRPLSRVDFGLAFDPISEPENYSFTSGRLDASAFDRHFSIITLDLAPYARSIVANDNRLQQNRVRLSNLLSEGGRQGKRMRTTRAAMSALEGGIRSTTRKDRYFGPGLNSIYVMNTGMPGWTEAAEAEVIKEQASRKEEGSRSDGESSVEERCTEQEKSETENPNSKRKPRRKLLQKQHAASSSASDEGDELAGKSPLHELS